MEFTNKFHVPLPLDEAWKLMLDVPRIMPCLPGATLTEVMGDNQYRGSVSVKLGPIKLSFDGQAELVRTDDVNHIAWLHGSGLDPKGRGAAQSEFSFALTPDGTGAGTNVTVTTQLQLTGAVAQYGRGSGMIAEVAGHILKQFEENLADSLNEAPAIELAQPASHFAQTGHMAGKAVSGAPSTTVPGTLAPPPTGSTDAQIMMLQAQAVLAQAQAVLAATQHALMKFDAADTAARKRAPKELNMLSIGSKALWSQIKHSMSGAFRKS